MPRPAHSDRSLGPVRPAFLAALAETTGAGAAEFEELGQLFERGDYAGLRVRVAALSSSNPELLQAAQELVKRTEPDRKVLWLFLLAGLLLLLVSAFAYGQP